MGSLSTTARENDKPARLGRSWFTALVSIILLFLLLPAPASAETTPEVTLVQPIQPSATLPQDKTPKSSERVTPKHDVPPVPKAPPWRYAIIAALLAMALALFQLASNFSRYLGLGVVLNPYSIILLTVVGCVAGTSAIFLTELTQNPVSGEAIAKLMSTTSHMIEVTGATLLGNFSTLIGRLFKRKQMDDGSGELLPGLKRSSPNVLFDFIQTTIEENLHERLSLIAREYRWTVIKPAVCRIIEGKVAANSLNRDAAQAALARLKALEPPPSAPQEFDANYSALCEAVSVIHYLQLKHRLSVTSRLV